MHDDTTVGSTCFITLGEKREKEKIKESQANTEYRIINAL